jgi:hypothetical protein
VAGCARELALSVRYSLSMARVCTPPLPPPIHDVAGVEVSMRACRWSDPFAAGMIMTLVMRLVLFER